MALRALVINPSGEEVQGIVGDVLKEAEVVVDELATQETVNMLVSGDPSPNARVVPALPASSAEHDLLVILGSPLGVLTVEPEEGDGQTPLGTIKQIEKLVLDFHHKEKPVLGICLGSQLVARTFGGQVSKMPKDEAHTALAQPSGPDQRTGIEFGWHTQDFSAAAESDPVIGPALKAMRDTIGSKGSAGGVPKFMEWHSDCFEIPAGAVTLSRRQSCPSQAFRMGRRTYAFQYHIEVDEEMGRSWYEDFTEGSDSFEDKGDWQQVKSEGKKMLQKDLDDAVAQGSVAAAEAFTRSAVRGLLEQATEARRERFRGRLATAAAAALALGAVALALRLSKPKRA